MGEFPKARIWTGLLLAAAACRSGGLVGVDVNLNFSSPDYPTAVLGLDAGLVEIDFGPVAVNSTKTLTLSVASISGTAVTLGSLTPLRADPEFSLPSVSGTAVEPWPPSQIAASFSPSSTGTKTAVYSLAYSPPAGGEVTIELSGESVPSGLGVTPNPVDFGDVELNQTQPVSLTITNDAETSASLGLSSLRGPNASLFSLGPLSGTILAPGGSATLNVFFAPLAIGPASASFTVAGSVGDGTVDPPTAVSLVGTGVQSWLQVASPLDFGFVPPGRTLVKSVLLKNAGSFTTLYLTAPGPHLAQPSGTSAFAPPFPPLVLPMAIPPGQTAQIPVSFTPPVLGKFPATLLLATDDPANPAPVIQLEGNGGGPQILCLSPLDFGPVPLGRSGSRQTLCVNAGTDIPGDADGGLRIDQSDLATDDPAFAANLVLPDGGPAGPDFSVLLAPGQGEAIQVTFQPDEAGIHAARLLVPSSDFSDADAGVALLGQGIVPGPCSIGISPLQLDFGEVPSGDTGILEFEIDNTGQDLCLLGGVSLDPRSDPAFSLPGGNLGYQLLSFPGDSDNPAGLPSSLIVDVQFAPSAAESAAAGSIDLTISNATPTTHALALSASSAAACLTIQPTSYDFGAVGFSPSSQGICVSDTRSFTALNGCGAPVTITQLDIASGVATTPQFSLESALQLPFTIAPGSQAGFASSFTPSAPGAKLGGITVGTSEFSDSPFLVTLRGDAETSGARSDTFIAAGPGEPLDILWILDEDDALPQVNLLASFLPAIVGVMNEEQVDYRMAVTSTDTCDGGSSDQGSFEPCDHCLSKVSTDPLYITPQTTAPATALSDLFSLFDVPPEVGFCASINGGDHFFDSIADAFGPALLGGHNAGFLREGAALAVVLVNGDFENDGAGGPDRTTLAQVTALLQGLELDPTMVSVSCVNCAPGEAPDDLPIDELVQATAGVEINTQSAPSNWESLLPDFFTEGVGAFHLSSRPVDPNRIEIDVDGVVAPIWSYDASLNDIVFPAADLPAPGSTLTATYAVGCP